MDHARSGRPARAARGWRCSQPASAVRAVERVRPRPRRVGRDARFARRVEGRIGDHQIGRAVAQPSGAARLGVGHVGDDHPHALSERRCARRFRAPARRSRRRSRRDRRALRGSGAPAPARPRRRPRRHRRLPRAAARRRGGEQHRVEADAMACALLPQPQPEPGNGVERLIHRAIRRRARRR